MCMCMPLSSQLQHAQVWPLGCPTKTSLLWSSAQRLCALTQWDNYSVLGHFLIKKMKHIFP